MLPPHASGVKGAPHPPLPGGLLRKVYGGYDPCETKLGTDDAERTAGERPGELREGGDVRFSRRQRKAAEHRANRAAKQRRVRSRQTAIREARKAAAKPSQGEP